MRAQRTAARAALVLGIAGVGFALWSATEDTAAHAADKTPAVVVEQPGGLLERLLPAQASDRAKQVVDQVVPKAQAKPHPKPKAKPAPKPEHTEPAAPKPPVDLPPVVVDVLPLTDEPAPEPEPAPDVITLPVDDLAPLPDAEDLPILPGLPGVPAPPVVPLVPVVAPGTLPVPIGPIPALQPGPAATLPAVHPATAVDALDVAVCDDPPGDAINVDHDTIGQLIASLTEATASPRAQLAPGCPGTPGHLPPAHIDFVPGSTAGSTYCADIMAAACAAGPAWPMLARLEHARARSALPTGRTAHLDPRPA